MIRLVRALPRGKEARVLGDQVLRAATSVGANYRAARRGKSRADFIAKLAIAEEESDETCYWLELIARAGLIPNARLHSIMAEANEITAILTAAGKTSKQSRGEAAGKVGRRKSKGGS